MAWRQLPVPPELLAATVSRTGAVRPQDAIDPGSGWDDVCDAKNAGEAQAAEPPDAKEPGQGLISDFVAEVLAPKWGRPVAVFGGGTCLPQSEADFGGFARAGSRVRLPVRLFDSPAALRRALAAAQSRYDALPAADQRQVAGPLERLARLGYANPGHALSDSSVAEVWARGEQVAFVCRLALFGDSPAVVVVLERAADCTLRGHDLFAAAVAARNRYRGDVVGLAMPRIVDLG